MDDQVLQTSPQRIFVTGATGFLGRTLIRQLSAKHTLAALRYPPDLPDGLEKLSLTWVPGKLDTIDLAGYDVVLHLAAQESGSPVQVRAVNVAGTEAMLSGCRRHGVQKFLYISSLDAALGRADAYGETKREAESLVRASGLDWMILRPSALYGAWGNNLLCKLLRRAAKGRAVPLIGSGSQLIQPLQVADLIGLIERVITRPFGRLVLELGGPAPITYAEALHHAAELAGKNLRAIPIPHRALALFLIPLEAIWPGAPLTWSKVQSTLRSKTVEIEIPRRHFGFVPRSFVEGLQAMLTGERLLAES